MAISVKIEADEKTIKKLKKKDKEKQVIDSIKEKIDKKKKLTIEDINVKLDIILEMLQELKPKR